MFVIVFWKYGKQVDPFKQKLPAAEPLKKSLRPKFLAHIIPLKEQLNNIKDVGATNIKTSLNPTNTFKD
jgi:hypothetical protein